MSVTDAQPPPETRDPVSPPRPRPALISWGRVAVACAILLASWGVRTRQAERIRRDLQRGLASPMRLDTVPMEFGPWKGQPTDIDPMIARGTGADQVVTRRYVNQNTGVAFDVILLFGPAVEMYHHLPENCYPAAGYAAAAGPEEVRVRTGAAGPTTVPFRALVYSRGEGGLAELQEVLYSWRYNDRWTPNVGKQKHFERISGMYKLHVARRLTERELETLKTTGWGKDSPGPAFLNALLPEIEGRMPGARPAAS